MLGQLIVSGLAVGFCYALLALAMVIIYKTSDVLNFAQGEMAMISSFMAFVFLESYQISFPIALALTLLFAAALGALLEFAFLRPAKNPTVIGMIIITLGFEMILMGIAGWKWGPDQLNLPIPIPSFVKFLQKYLCPHRGWWKPLAFKARGFQFRRASTVYPHRREAPVR